MDKIVFKTIKNYITVSYYKKDIKENLNNTNVINTKEIYFSINYIKENLELVSSFLNVIILKHSIDKIIINEYDITPLILDIINYTPSIKELSIKPDKALRYDMFLKILDNNNLNTIDVYDIPPYLLERLDLNKKLTINIRCEILFTSNFMSINKLNTYSDIFYKKSIIINDKFNENDQNDFISFLNINNNYLKQIEFKYFDENIFKFIIDIIISLNKTNIKIIFDEEFIKIEEVFKIVNTYKNKKELLFEDNNITFKINYSEEYKKNNTFKQIHLNSIKVTLVAIIIVVSFMMSINIYRNYNDNKKTDNITDKIDTILETKINNQEDNQDIPEYIAPNSEEKKIINATTTGIYDIKYQMIFDELLKINKDTIGWLKVNNTNIDYPVVTGPDNDYYLKRDYYQNKNRHGWIFMDYRNNIDDLDKNTIIYGHNLANQKMFGTLRYALNSKWYKNKNNQIITFNTLNKNMKWQIFSIYKVPVTTDYLTTKFIGGNEYTDFIKMITDRSIYDFNVDVGFNDHILTLSTCSNGHDQRLVIHAKLIRE